MMPPKINPKLTLLPANQQQNILGLLQNPLFNAGMGLLSAGRDDRINPYGAALQGMQQAQQFKWLDEKRREQSRLDAERAKRLAAATGLLDAKQQGGQTLADMTRQEAGQTPYRFIGPDGQAQQGWEGPDLTPLQQARVALGEAGMPLAAANMMEIGNLPGGASIVGSPQKLKSGNLGYLSSTGEMVDTGQPFYDDPYRITDIGGVPHIFDRSSQTMKPVRVQGQAVTPELVAESSGTVAAGAKAGEQAIKMSGEAMDQLPKIRTAISNIDDAIAAIDNGAQTGAVISQFPSIRQASVELDNVRSRMGLDIVGATTFGALSKGELDLALNTALPTKMEPPALRDWLIRKKAAQTKLASELEKAAVYLGTPGNTPAEYMKMMKVEKSTKRRRYNPETGKIE